MCRRCFEKHHAALHAASNAVAASTAFGAATAGSPAQATPVAAVLQVAAQLRAAATAAQATSHGPLIAIRGASASAAAVPAAATTFAPSSPVLAPKQSRKRRAESDPGESASLQTRSHSAAAALLGLANSATHAPPSVRPPVHEAHASPTDITQRYQAILAAEQAELAARTPAQWARRKYLMSVAPRCERCNFPRTGRKGWDKKTGCHTDKNCNLYRWRAIDAFC